MNHSQVKALLMKIYQKYNIDKSRDIQQWIQDVTAAITGVRKQSFADNLSTFTDMFTDIQDSKPDRGRKISA